MKFRFTLGLLFFICVSNLSATSHAEQLLHIQVSDVRDISFDSTYLDFDMNSSTAGVLDPVTVNATYDITHTSDASLSIYAKLDANPAANNFAISMSLAAPSGGASAGNVSLSTAFQAVVTSIENVSGSNLQEHVTVAPSGGAAPAEGSYVYVLEFILAE
ncbi:MAG: hypothetical protein MRY21_02845 [Simkaniaceae bacterium]|nr:hypothetical protein [Simkaniaceae bacterium]